MKTLDELRYTKTHEWVRVESDGTVRVGITDHAQAQLGDLVFIETPQPGQRVAAGEECAVVESVKAAADIYAPISGTVIAANAEATGSPEKVNQDAYSAWLFSIKPDNAGELADLLDASAYRKQVESEAH